MLTFAPSLPSPAPPPAAPLSHGLCSAGCVITISGRMTFTSNKSMEIEVLVDADPVVDNSQKRYRAASAFFTYVSLSQEGKPLPVPQLVVSDHLWPVCPRDVPHRADPVCTHWLVGKLSHISPFWAAGPHSAPKGSEQGPGLAAPWTSDLGCGTGQT